jgi:ribosome biogenesis GTPase
MEGKIVKIISSDFTVSSENFLYTCKARGKFRNQNITPIVGDNVIFENNVINVTFASLVGVPDNIDSLKNAIDKAKPAYLLCNYIFNWLHWDLRDSWNLTWDERDSKNIIVS